MTIETARRHGHSDPRFARRPRLRLIQGGEAPSDDGREAVVQAPRGLTLADAQDDRVSAWEDEGGRYAPTDLPVGETTPELDWDAFRESVFPGRRRHDFAAVKAYAAYRATGLDAAAAAAIPWEEAIGEGALVVFRR